MYAGIHRKRFRWLAVPSLWAFAATASAASIQLKVDRAGIDTPVTLGVPFPKGALRSADHVNVLNARGVEIPSHEEADARAKPPIKKPASTR